MESTLSTEHDMTNFSFQYQPISNCICACVAKTMVHEGVNYNKINIITKITQICNVGHISIKQTGYYVTAKFRRHFTNVSDVCRTGCESSDDLWPLRQTQIIIRSLIPKLWTFPATPALVCDNL